MEIKVDRVRGTVSSNLILKEEKMKGQGIPIRFDNMLGCVERDQYHKRSGKHSNASLLLAAQDAGAWTLGKMS